MMLDMIPSSTQRPRLATSLLALRLNGICLSGIFFKEGNHWKR